MPTDSQTLPILSAFPDLRIGVLGDFCLDAYWRLAEGETEYSLETGKPTRVVAEQSYSLGGAGNVVSNLKAAGVGGICVFGVIGDDLFGREMRALLQQTGAATGPGLIVQTQDWDTSVYAKPHVGQDEQERIDFGRNNRISGATLEALLAALAEALPALDALIINQQLRSGVHSDGLVAELNALVDRTPEKVVLLDARDVADRYTGVTVKANAREAARLCGAHREVGHAVTEEELRVWARAIHERTRRPVIITRSDRGILAFDGADFLSVPGVLIFGQVDPVGAGDTTAALIASALAAGAPLADAIELGNLGGAIVSSKLWETGTATPAELRKAACEAQYVHRPELAEDIRRAEYWRDTEIELIAPSLRTGDITHAIFDHDGTISTLRQGWEEVMESMMVRVILGKAFSDASEELYHRVRRVVQGYIERSTGIETIRQMEQLVEMVQRFGLVPLEEQRDALGYKEVYNHALSRMVHLRLEKLERGELTVDDFTIKGAVNFARGLAERGVTLHLASGSDHEDVLREARALGYAGLFTGGIHGWAGPGTGSAKQKVIEDILARHRLSGSGFVCIGDGPVELRLARREGGVALGVAGDEVRRWGLNPAKRARLIKAGADLLVPDFSQHEMLLDLLFRGAE